MSKLRKSSTSYVDVPCFISPCDLAGDSLRPDLLLGILDKCLYTLELIVGSETNLRTNSHRKQLN